MPSPPVSWIIRLGQTLYNRPVRNLTVAPALTTMFDIVLLLSRMTFADASKTAVASDFGTPNSQLAAVSQFVSVPRPTQWFGPFVTGSALSFMTINGLTQSQCCQLPPLSGSGYTTSSMRSMPERSAVRVCAAVFVPSHADSTRFVPPTTSRTANFTTLDPQRPSPSADLSKPTTAENADPFPPSLMIKWLSAWTLIPFEYDCQSEPFQRRKEV